MTVCVILGLEVTSVVFFRVVCCLSLFLAPAAFEGGKATLLTPSAYWEKIITNRVQSGRTHKVSKVNMIVTSYLVNWLLTKAYKNKGLL